MATNEEIIREIYNWLELEIQKERGYDQELAIILLERFEKKWLGEKGE